MGRRFILGLLIIIGSASFALGQDTANPFKILGPLKEALHPLPFGAVRPSGWLKAQIQQNLDGFTGHLDSLCPDLVVKDDIYGKDRLTRKVRNKDVGAFSADHAADVQYLWWNSETQSNWWDGLIRSAVLTGDAAALAKASAYVQRILSTQDSDGYLGIYDRDLRYHFRDENGELWSKTTLLRGLLAWYDYTRDASVLQTVERATLNLMRGYPADTSRPFYSIHPNVGGLSHGLVFTDVLETLYRCTGKRMYEEYCVFLYKNFSKEVLNEDAQYGKLMDTAYRLKGHGVHTYEHIRAVAAAAYASGNPALREALLWYIIKLSDEINPSGGAVGDEWIGGRKADPTYTGYEYCSLQELLNVFTDLMSKTGDSGWGDNTERLFFNAAQGARNPDHSGIAYLKTDNSYYMTGPRNGDTSQHHQTRYTYSPVHQDAAVCCVPNAGRIAPYFVESMWMTGPQGPVATLLGPCMMRTTWMGDSVRINEQTEYPFDMSVRFVVDVDRPQTFTLSLRQPEWAEHPEISVNEKPIVDSIRFGGSSGSIGGYFRIHRTWKKGDKILLHLDASMQMSKDTQGQSYFTYGPLVLAHPLASTYTITKDYPLPGFHDYSYSPDSLLIYQYKGGAYERSGSGFQALMMDPTTGKPTKVSLVPMARTILRQVTF